MRKLNASLMKSNSKAFKILTHTDAAQAIGKIYVDVQDLGCDYLTIVGHKFYGPRIGAIYHRTGSPNMPPIFYGGFQERGLRCGTENTPMIIGLGEAANLVTKNLEADHITLKSLRDCFVSEIKVNKLNTLEKWLIGSSFAEWRSGGRSEFWLHCVEAA